MPYGILAWQAVLCSSASNTFPVSQPPKGPRPQENLLLDLAVKTNNTFTSRLVRLSGQVRHGCSGGRIHSPRTDSNYVDDDIHSLLQILPHDLRESILCDTNRAQLLEVSIEELEYAQNALGEFGGNNRTGIAGTLHRISAIRNKNGRVVGLTCRLGRPVREIIDMTRDLLEYGKSILFLGRPGVGKTTVIRGISHVLSDELLKIVIVVDTSNEIGGDGDIPHPAIGGARRLQVPDPCMKHKVMIEAVDNHMPEVIIVDEIGTEAEVHACHTIAQRGVMLIGSAHGKQLENIIKNPILSDLTDKSVDELLQGKKPLVEVRRIDKQFKVVIERWQVEE
ncbi:UNVERIFIED_CONTAM: putative protein ycf45 [Sesamum radiatum]|uniref:AAA+ ATPase domain-containing protein n=1 Tax=Sesamum radiatum TaxID=300843 RepID=A0AAW2M4M3_SESRA